MRQVIYGYINRAIGRITLAIVAWLLAQQGVAVAQTIKVDMAPARFYVIDFMTVRDCALKSTILKNKTRIAQYASDSQQLLLDLEYLRLAPACFTQKKIQGMEALAQTLSSTHSLIKLQLPGRIFNATLGSSQFRKVWQTDGTESEHPLATDLPLLALREINRAVRAWLTGNYAADNLQFELQLSEVAKARVYYGDWHAQQLAELIQLETLLQGATPTSYRQWQQQRKESLRQRNHYSNTLSN